MKLEIKLCTDCNSKYYVDFYLNNKLFITNQNGEAEIVFENEDRSETFRVNSFKGETAQQNGDEVILKSKIYIEKLTTYVNIEVTYRRVSDLCFEKTIIMKQTNIPMLFFSVAQQLTGPDADSLWSFDNENHAGGIVHGTYPAIGFTNSDKASAGILSDAGHRNLFTRNIRRRPTPGHIGFTATQRICDDKMLTLKDKSAFMRLGGLTDYKHGEKTEYSYLERIPMSGCSLNGDIISGVNDFGAYFHYNIPDGYYTLSFDYCSSAPAIARILKKDEKSEVRAFHYQENMPYGKEQKFKDTFFISDTEGFNTLVKIYAKEKDGQSGTISVKNIQLVRHLGEEMPYHKLFMDKPEVRKTFIFACHGSDIRTLRLASQLNLADGLGYKGTDTERVLYADMQMLTWITSEHDFTPLNVPSINYAPDMYNRDSFWSVCGIDDAQLSIAIFERWGATQADSGGICTIVTPCMGSIEVKDNEATCEWLWWALINKQKYGYDANKDKLQKAWEYCLNNFDPKHTGICEAHFVLGQNDVTTYPDDKKTTNISLNQGVWAVTLKAARALGLDVSDKWVDAAVANYRSFYSEERGYLLNDRLFLHAIGAGDLMPEFVSLWLFNEAMLDDYMVCNTVARIPHENEFGFIIGHADERYFSPHNKPYDAEFGWPNGVYYNGASWMREEVMAYATASRHNWPQAKARYDARMKGEINIKWDEPFSHEFIPTDLSVEGCWWPSIRVFCWNVFALRAKELGNF